MEYHLYLCYHTIWVLTQAFVVCYVQYVAIMSGRVCFLCGKGATQARLISHANNKTKRKMYPNLRLLKIAVEGLNQRVKLCVKCYRIEREKIKKLELSQKTEKILATARAGQQEKTF